MTCHTCSSPFLLPSNSRSTIRPIFGCALIMTTWSQYIRSVLLLSLLSITEISMKKKKKMHHACMSEFNGITLARTTKTLKLYRCMNICCILILALATVRKQFLHSNELFLRYTAQSSLLQNQASKSSSSH